MRVHAGELFVARLLDIGVNALQGLIRIALIVAVAYAIMKLMRAAFNRLETWLIRATERTESPTGAATKRIKTLAGVLWTISCGMLWFVVALTSLSQIGVNIGPILAGAGVVGLAIGFGAQTLVKDVITGIFILAEDTVAVGDVVDLGGHVGVVEAMTLRSIRLRDHTGAVHTIPFSAVSTVMNMTRDFGYAVFDIGIAYSEDLDRVIDLLRKLGDEMRQDEAFARDIREPIEVMGITRFVDNAVIIRVRLKTAPGRQWDVEREFNRRLKRLFEEHGIARANAAATPTIYLSEARPKPQAPTVAGRLEPAPQS